MNANPISDCMQGGISFLTILACFLTLSVQAQDIHFSQYYNTPMLQNPANTALMSDREFRTSAIYRDQWSSIPAPFKTFAFAAEFQALRNDQFTNWLGIGMYALTDKAGDGDLALTSYGFNLAYHLMLGQSSILSVGGGASYNTRSIDFSKLTFDAQWDGFTFNRSLPNGEMRSFEKNTYVDVYAGINYAYFPSEFLYFKIGAGLAHINRPQVSLLGQKDNRLDFRPMITTDAIVEMENGWRVMPSAYLTFMQKATNIIVGGTVAKNFVSKDMDQVGNIFTGVYHRFNESIITVLGIEWSNVKLTASYDITTSTLARANNGNGAFELSLIFQGFYGSGGLKGKSPWECPRF